MIPSSWCKGVKLTEDSGVAVNQGTVRRITSFSYLDGLPGPQADASAELARPIGDIGWKVLRVVCARIHRAACGKSGGTDDKATASRPRSVVRVSHRNLPAHRTPGGSYHILFYECNRIATNPQKFLRSYSVRAALFCSRQCSVRPAPKPPGLRCPH